MLQKAKILLVGPSESGKTTLANFLSDAAEIGSGDYRPTKGCRIVEFESNISVNDVPLRVEVELWDVGGDTRYSHCWPAIQRGTNGVIFVFNPGNEDHPKSLDSLHSQFASQQGLKDSQCIVFCHQKPDSGGFVASKLQRPVHQNSMKIFQASCGIPILQVIYGTASSFSGIAQVDSQLSEEGNSRLHEDFKRFLGQVFSHMSDMAEKHENAMLQ